MGCDIHMWAEVRKRRVIDGTMKEQWYKIGNMFTNPYYDKKEAPFVYDDGYESNCILTDHPYNERNYDLFAILADVRNGYGFGGVDTGDGFITMSSPRGLPEDVSKNIQKESDDYGADGHSHSWISLKEILEYNWDFMTQKRGIVTPVEYKFFLENGKPRSWCGGVGGANTEIITNEEMNEYLKTESFVREQEYANLEKIAGDMFEMYGKDSNQYAVAAKNRQDFGKKYVWHLPKNYYTQVTWSVSYRDAAGKDWWNTVEQLKKISLPEDVRIVFFFDN